MAFSPAGTLVSLCSRFYFRENKSRLMLGLLRVGLISFWRHCNEERGPSAPGPLRSSRCVQTGFFLFSPNAVSAYSASSHLSVKELPGIGKQPGKKVEGGVVAHSPDRRANCHARGGKMERPLFDLISFEANPKEIERKNSFFKLLKCTYCT